MEDRNGPTNVNKYRKKKRLVLYYHVHIFHSIAKLSLSTWKIIRKIRKKVE